jgi:hypothetical protein
MSADGSRAIMLSGRGFVTGCAIVACVLFALGRAAPLPMLFILGLTFFVAVIAQTRLLGADVSEELAASLDRSCRRFNNIVADFASRALADFDARILQLFAMAQIAGYALGGCWTHIGSAQSVVAYSFIQRDVDAGYTPVQWIAQMTPVILEMFAMITVVIAIESWLFAG